MNRHAALFACKLVLVGILALAAGRPALAQQVEADSLAMDWSRVPEYRIVPGDKLVLDLGPRADAPINNRIEQVVRPDGRITVYPIGDVVAAGLTPMDLQRSVTSLLSADLRSPRVTVELSATTTNLVHVLGRVTRPGPVPAGPFITVSQAIAGAGGFSDDAARNSVVIIHRNGANSVRVARLRMDRVLKGEDLVDPPLSRFDIVYVPRSSVGNLSVFMKQFFEPLAPIMDTAMKGWELFNLDRVYVTRVVRD
ncbi:MAG: polysaccharide biosynthesis/export family protein [Candidatus Eisenbacteria bacterium]|nr:polysaccharide biosynthesis/export family protein [Candidatus Eisenbacteria bacterium]